MTEQVLLIYKDGLSASLTVPTSEISKLAQKLLRDKSILGFLFLDRWREDGPPPAPKDKGGE
jgi:hypothetical protein